MKSKIRSWFFQKKYYFLILVTALIFFYPIFKGHIPFPGDLLLNYYEPYRAYPILNYPPAGVPTKNQGADVVRHMFPWKYFAIDSLKRGEIPFWDPYNFSGNSLMANFQSAVFYPLNIIFFAMPFLSAWTIYIFLAVVLAAFFTFLFLREIKLSKLASLFGSLVFAFSSYMVVWLEYGNIGHTFLWLPLGLFFVEKIIKTGNLKYNLYLALALLMSVLAGYIQGYFYVAGVIFIYFTAKNILNKSLTLNKFLIFSGTLFLPILLSLFQTLPTKELFEESTRSNYTLSQIQYLLNPWWYTITTIAPNFFGNPSSNNHWFYGTYIERVSYIGVIPFLLFVYALLNLRKKKESLIFGAVGLISFVLSLDLFVTKYFFQIPIPLLSTTVPTRILCVFAFSAAVMAAIGFDYLKDRYNKRTLFASAIFVFLLFVIAWGFAFLGSNLFSIDSSNLAVARRNLIIPTGLFLSFVVLSFLWIKKFKFALVLIFILTIFDLFYLFNKITPFSPKEFVYPQTPIVKFLQENASINRFWGYGSGYIESDFQTFDKTFSPEGVDPIHIRRYARLLEASKDGKITEDLPRPDANLPAGYGTTNLRENKYRQRLMNLLGVKYVLHKNVNSLPDYHTFPDDIYTLVYHDGYYQAYENKEALPRVFLAPGYIVETDRQRIVDKIFDPNFELKKTLILEEKVIPEMKFAKDDNYLVKVNKYEGNKVLISTSAKTNMLLFLSDTYSPGWKARVDGKEVDIYRADYAFRAVPIPLGNHKVEFYYIPQAYVLGLEISAVTALFLIGFIIWLKKNEKI